MQVLVRLHAGARWWAAGRHHRLAPSAPTLFGLHFHLGIISLSVIRSDIIVVQTEQTFADRN